MLNISNPDLIKDASYINGEWLKGQNTITVTNPANGDVITHVANASPDEAELAIKAAKRALSSWSAKSANERSKILRQWFDLMMHHQDDLAVILTTEQGKPLAEAKGEIAYGAAFIEWFAEEAKRIYGDTIPAPSSDKRIIVIKQPIGVVAAITPWNFPNAMLARKAAAALAAGCTFIVKPSALTPLSALAMAELAEKAGIPKGVFNVIISDDSKGVGQVLTEHPDVAKFTFTGSTAVGKLLIKQCSSTVKRVSMELGGNAPFIVFDDADIDAAVQGALVSKYRNAGQTCVCTNRIFVHEKVMDEFSTKFKSAVEGLKVGEGLGQDVSIGPIINAQARDNIIELIKNSEHQGAKTILGGQPHTAGDNFLQPTIIVNVKNNMSIAQTEIFGPVSTIISFNNEKDVIEMANDTEFGLAAYFYARDIGRIWRVAEGLAYGMVGINEGIISNVAAPFGGVKQSGNGREGSKYGLDDYVEIKYICMGGLDQ